MKRTILAGFILFAAGLGFGAVGARSLAATQAAPTRTMLLTVDLPELQGKQARMWITELAPGAATAKHSHPGHVMGYVLEGGLVHQVEGAG